MKAEQQKMKWNNHFGRNIQHGMEVQRQRKMVMKSEQKIKAHMKLLEARDEHAEKPTNINKIEEEYRRR